jgi:hypothetical protein
MLLILSSQQIPPCVVGSLYASGWVYLARKAAIDGIRMQVQDLQDGNSTNRLILQQAKSLSGEFSIIQKAFSINLHWPDLTP